MIDWVIALIGCLAIIVIGALISKWLNIEQARVRFNQRKMAAVRAAKKTASGAGTTEHPEHPAWLTELIESLGYDEEILDSDEMPELLEKFMPMIRGFLADGGLDKLKSAPTLDDFGAI